MPFFEATATAGELSLLASLKGRTLQSVSRDFWSVGCAFSEGVVRFLPEEIRTPDETHPYADVVRVRPALDSTLRPSDVVVARDLGIINEVRIQSITLMFSPPTPGGPVNIGKVVLPAGMDYHPIFLESARRLPPALDVLAVARVDAVVVLVTERSVVRIGSNTVGFFILTDADPVGAPKLRFPAEVIKERVVSRRE